MHRRTVLLARFTLRQPITTAARRLPHATPGSTWHRYGRSSIPRTCVTTLRAASHTRIPDWDRRLPSTVGSAQGIRWVMTVQETLIAWLIQQRANSCLEPL